jgi:hypothetical protein
MEAASQQHASVLLKVELKTITDRVNIFLDITI